MSMTAQWTAVPALELYTLVIMTYLTGCMSMGVKVMRVHVALQHRRIGLTSYAGCVSVAAHGTPQHALKLHGLAISKHYVICTSKGVLGTPKLAQQLPTTGSS